MMEDGILLRAPTMLPADMERYIGESRAYLRKASTYMTSLRKSGAYTAPDVEVKVMAVLGQG